MSRTGSFLVEPRPCLRLRRRPNTLASHSRGDVSQSNRAQDFRVDTVGPLDACYPRNPGSKISLPLHLKVLKGQPYEQF